MSKILSGHYQSVSSIIEQPRAAVIDKFPIQSLTVMKEEKDRAVTILVKYCR